MTTINGAGAMAPRSISFTQAIETDSLRPLGDSALGDKVGKGQVLDKTAFASFSAVELDRDINAYQPSESDWQDFVAASLMPGDEVRNDLVFDPGAWEKHANVLVAAIIALNIARVTNAELRGHFSIMAADAAKSQGAAIVESGKAALHSAITAAVVSGAVAGFAMVKTFQGQALKHADISLHKRNSLDANNIERDLKRDRASERADSSPFDRPLVHPMAFFMSALHVYPERFPFIHRADSLCAIA